MIQFDILEVKPPSPFKSVCLINTDVEIDFAPPLDYVEPAPRSPKNKPVAQDEPETQSNGFSAFTGGFQRLDGKKVKIDPTVKENPDLYDPRKVRLVKGVRKYGQLVNEFAGKGVRIS